MHGSGYVIWGKKGSSRLGFWHPNLGHGRVLRGSGPLTCSSDWCGLHLSNRYLPVVRVGYFSIGGGGESWIRKH